ncbi:3865_t:CDS:2, partial [Acaulospora colombiana]
PGTEPPTDALLNHLDLRPIATPKKAVSNGSNRAVPFSRGPPDAKTRKYDRQLRLWAATGQAALEGARLLVIGATATSTSLLKNLVLPGIGHFTILDLNITKPEDVGNNFFLEVDSIGKQKAVEAARLLSELNESVQSAAEIDDVADILEKRPEWIANYTLVFAHNLPRKI